MALRVKYQYYLESGEISRTDFVCDGCERILDWILDPNPTELIEIECATMWSYCPFCAEPLEFHPAWEEEGEST